MSEEAVRRAIKSNHEKIVKFTSKLVRINSVNGNETTVAEAIAAELNQAGIKSTLFGADPARQSLVATIGSGSRSLMLNGHLDTVSEGDADKWRYPPFSGTVGKSRLYGRGSYDMKGADAAAVYAMIALAQSDCKLKGKVKLVLNSDEESGYHTGIREVLKRGIRADAAICCEPMSDDSMAIGAKGIFRFELTTMGTSGHTGYRKGRVNAVTKMAKLLLRLERVRFSYKKHPKFSAPYVTPGTVIQGGVGINVFPESCSALVDCRLSLGQQEKDVRREIKECLDAACAKDPEIRYAIRPIGFVPAGYTEPKHDFAKLSRIIVEESYGVSPKTYVMGGVTDGNFLMDLGIPTVIYGPTGGGIHSENEYVNIKSLRSAAESYAITAIRFLS